MIGEHIRALRADRWDHAIDCGDETVIHLAAAPEPPRVRRSYRPAFVEGAQAVQLVTERARTFPPQEVVARAYSRLADPTLAAMFQDSQAFAEWCTTGRMRGRPRDLAPRAPGERSTVPAGADAKRQVRPTPGAMRSRPAAKTLPKAKRSRPAAKAVPKASRGRPARSNARKAGEGAPLRKRKRGTRR